MRTLTALQQARWDAYVAEGGDDSPGAQARAARALGVTQGTLASSLAGYRAITDNDGHVAKPRRSVRSTEIMRDIAPRLDVVEGRMAAIEAAIAALTGVAFELRADIRRWTERQPIYVEMRPRHQRTADGGEGGVKEARALKRITA